MLKCKMFFMFFLVSFSSLIAQEKQDSLKVKENPIIFGNISLSYADGYIRGGTASFSINYQKKKTLFTFQFLQNYKVEETKAGFIFRIPVQTRTFNEYSLLIGKRYIKNDFSFHFSGGISYNNTLRKNSETETTTLSNYIGFPLRIGYNFFHSKKERFRTFFDLIPLGKPTSFGKSFGLNLYANIAKKSYIGVGFTLGLGWHKIYKNEK